MIRLGCYSKPVIDFLPKLNKRGLPLIQADWIPPFRAILVLEYTLLHTSLNIFPATTINGINVSSKARTFLQVRAFY